MWHCDVHLKHSELPAAVGDVAAEESMACHLCSEQNEIEQLQHVDSRFLRFFNVVALLRRCLWPICSEDFAVQELPLGSLCIQC